MIASTWIHVRQMNSFSKNHPCIEKAQFDVQPANGECAVVDVQWNEERGLYCMKGVAGVKYDLYVQVGGYSSPMRQIVLSETGSNDIIDIELSVEDPVLYDVRPSDFGWRFQWEHWVAQLPYTWDFLAQLQAIPNNTSSQGRLRFGNGDLVANIMDEGLTSAWALAVSNANTFAPKQSVAIVTGATIKRTVVLYVLGGEVVIDPLAIPLINVEINVSTLETVAPNGTVGSGGPIIASYQIPQGENLTSAWALTLPNANTFASVDNVAIVTNGVVQRTNVLSVTPTGEVIVNPYPLIQAQVGISTLNAISSNGMINSSGVVIDGYKAFSDTLSLTISSTNTFTANQKVVVRTNGIDQRTIILSVETIGSTTTVTVDRWQRNTPSTSYTRNVIAISSNLSTIATVQPDGTINSGGTTITGKRVIASHPDLGTNVVLPNGNTPPKIADLLDQYAGTGGMFRHHHVPTAQHGNKCGSVLAGGSRDTLANTTEGIVGVAPNVRLLGSLLTANLQTPSGILGGNAQGIVNHFIFKWMAGFKLFNWPLVYNTSNLPSPLETKTTATTLKKAIDVFSLSAGYTQNEFKIFELMTSFGRNRKGILIFQGSGNTNRDATQKLKMGGHHLCMAVAGSTLASSGFEQRAAYSSWIFRNRVGTASERQKAIDFCAPTGTNHVEYFPPKSYKLSSAASATIDLTNGTQKGNLLYFSNLTSSNRFTLGHTTTLISTVYQLKLEGVLTGFSQGTAVSIEDAAGTTVVASLSVLINDGNYLWVADSGATPIGLVDGYQLSDGTVSTKILINHYYTGIRSRLRHTTLDARVNAGNISVGTLLVFGDLSNLTGVDNLNNVEFGKVKDIEDLDPSGSGGVTPRYILTFDRRLLWVTEQLSSPSSSVVVNFGEQTNSTFGGTSGACPFAAGIATLVLTANPNLTYAEARAILQETAIPVDLRMGKENYNGVSGVDHRWLEIDDATTVLPIVDENHLLHISKVGNINTGNRIRAQLTGLQNQDASFTTSGLTFDLPQVTQLTIIPDSASNITMANFTIGNSLLVGAEATLVSHSGTTITVSDDRGFESNQTIVVGDGTVAYLYKHHNEGARALYVTNCNGFSPLQNILITDPLNPSTSEVVTINRLVNVQYFGTLYSHALVLKTPLANSYPSFAEVKTVQEERLIVQKNGTTLILDAPLNPLYRFPTTAPSTGPLTVVRSKHAFLATIHAVDAVNNTLDLYPTIPTEVFDYLTDELSSGRIIHLWKGRRPDYNPALGYGRVDAFAAVHAAYHYDHNQRDIIIRNQLHDLGNQPTTFAHRIESPDIWVKNGAPNSSEILALEQAYLLPPEHEKPKRSNNRTVYVRVKNRGALESHNFSVQVYLALIPVGKPLNLDNAYNWQESYQSKYNGHDPITKFDDTNAPVDGASIILRQDSVTLGTAGADNYTKAAKELDMAHSRYVGYNAADHNSPLAPDQCLVLTFDWLADIKPDLTKWYNHTMNAVASGSTDEEYRLYLLAEVTPHDGPLHGQTAHNNNNLSYREIHLWQRIRYFPYLGSTTLLNHIKMVEEGETVDIPFVIVVDDESAINSNKIIVELTAAGHGSALPNTAMSYQYDGTTWDLFTPGVPATPASRIPFPTWLELSPPVDASTTDDPHLYYLAGVLKNVPASEGTFDFQTRINDGVKGFSRQVIQLQVQPKAVFLNQSAPPLNNTPLESVKYLNTSTPTTSIDFRIDLTRSAPENFDPVWIKDVSITLQFNGPTAPVSTGSVITFTPFDSSLSSWTPDDLTTIVLQGSRDVAANDPIMANLASITGSIPLPTSITNNASYSSIEIKLTYEQPVTHRSISATADEPRYHTTVFSHTMDLINMGDQGQAFREGGTPQLLGSQKLHTFVEFEDDNGNAQLTPKKGYNIAQDTSGQDDPTTFQVTTVWEAAPAITVRAYAALSGFVFLQKDNNGTYTLVLRPLFQSTIGFTRVKYFVYRGLNASYFEDAADPSLLKKSSTPDNQKEEDFMAFTQANHEARYAPSAPPYRLTLADMGYDPNNQNVEGTLDAYFTGSQADQQYAFVKRGMILGEISGGNDFGFEIILDETQYSPTLGTLQQTEHRVIVTTNDEDIARHQKQVILNYVDPAAYYGIHYWGSNHQVLVPDLSIANPYSNNTIDTRSLTGDDLYHQIIAHFPALNRNRLYVDVRNKNGYAYDYYDQYKVPNNNGNGFVNFKGSVAPSSAVRSLYGLYGWPLFYTESTDMQLNNQTADSLAYFVQLSKDSQYDSIIFAEYGYPTIYQGAVRNDKFIEIDADKESPLLQFRIPLVVLPSSQQRVAVAGILKLRYYKKVDPAIAPASDRDFPTAHFSDQLFGPLSAAYSRLKIAAVTTVVNGSELQLSLSGDYSTLLKKYEYLDLIQVGSSSTVIGKIAIQTHSPNGILENKVAVSTSGGATTTTVNLATALDLTNATTYPINELYVEVWGEQYKYEKTKWEVGIGTKLVDLSSDPDIRSAYVAKTGVGIEQELERVLFFATPQDFLYRNTTAIIDGEEQDYAEQAILATGGSETSQSLLVALQESDPSLLLQSKLVKIGTMLQPLIGLYQIDGGLGRDGKKVHFLGLAITQDEFRKLYALCLQNFSTTHDWYFTLIIETTDPKYIKYQLGVAGYNSSHEYSEKTLPPLDAVYVYGSAEYPSIFASADYAALQPFKLSKGLKSLQNKIKYKQPTTVLELINGGSSTLNSELMLFQSGLTALKGAGNYDEVAYKTLVQTTANNLWVNSAANMTGSMDYRSLFWARLYLQDLLLKHDYGNNSANKNSILTNQLLTIVEEYSRGISQVDFSSSTATKKILLVAFDTSYNKSKENKQNSTSAAVGLAIHNQTLGGTIDVQTVVLPLRYDDFDDFTTKGLQKSFGKRYGILEAAVGPHLQDVDAVVLLGTKQNVPSSAPSGKRMYYVERYVAQPRYAATGKTTYDNIYLHYTQAHSTKKELKKSAILYQPLFDGNNALSKFKKIKKAPNALNEDLHLDAQSAIPKNGLTLKMAAANNATTFPDDLVMLNQRYDGHTTDYTDPMSSDELDFSNSTMPSATANLRLGSNANTLYNEAYYRLLTLRHYYEQKTGNSLSAVLLSLPDLDKEGAWSQATLNTVTNFVKQLLIKGYL